MTYIYGASSEDREAWLDQKRTVVSATDVSALAHGGQAAWAKLKAEKAYGSHWSGNRYTQWGNEREPVIAGVMQEKYSYLRPNTHLLVQEADQRWAATPDMVSDFGLCQIKTSLWKGEEWAEPPARYVDQMLWELHVTGADESILAVEYYEETEHGFRVVDPFSPPQEFIIVRDDERIEYLVGLAEQFLALGEPSPMDALLADYADAEARLEAATADLNAVKEKIRHEIGDRKSYKHVSDLGSITLSTPKPTERFDSKAFKESDPDLYAKFVTTSQGKPRLAVKAA